MDKGKLALEGLFLTALALLLATSLAGVLLDDGGAPYAWETPRGEPVQLYGGGGPYRFDSTYKAVTFRAFDWASLLVVLPLGALALALHRRGRFRGTLLVAAIFAYLAYIYLIGAMGNAFNALFLAWTALFSLGGFGLFLALRSIDPGRLGAAIGARFPRRGLAAYVLVLGLVLLVQYLGEVGAAYAAARPPAALDHYTTLELAALELGIMVPLHFIAAAGLWRGRAWAHLLGTLLAFAAMMTFLALAGAVLAAYLGYGQGSAADLAITLGLSLLAGGAAVRTFLAWQDQPAARSH